MRISSTAFDDNGLIPAKYTCDGDDTIPPLTFAEVPADAKSLALIVDDPDAPMGTWDHWVVWNIGANVREIVEGRAPDGVTGLNSWKKNAWGGPCPPDREHRYFFKLYALDTMLSLPAKSKKSDVEAAMRGHILGEARIIGRYDRPRR